MFEQGISNSNNCLDMDPTCHTRPTRKCLSVALNRNRDLSGACNMWTPCRCRRAACSFIAGFNSSCILDIIINIIIINININIIIIILIIIILLLIIIIIYILYQLLCQVFPLMCIKVFSLEALNSEIDKYIHRSRGPTDTAATSKRSSILYPVGFTLSVEMGSNPGLVWCILSRCQLGPYH